MKTKKASADETVVETKEETVETRSPFRPKKLYLVAVLIGLFLVGIIYLVKTQLIAATVNGVPITRFELIKELEKQGGQSVLESMITDRLIRQEAQKQKVSVDPKEIDDQISQIEQTYTARGQSLDTALLQEKMTRDDLRKNIELQKLAEKMTPSEITVSDEEVDQYIKDNKDSLPKVISDDLKVQIKNQLAKEKSDSALQNWVTSLRDNAQINQYLSF